MAKPMEKASIKKADLQQLLNGQVANWAMLYIKIHQYHWYVKGPHFYTLHQKFEELYKEVDQYMDKIAERILALGGSPVSTTKEILASATIKEDKPGLDAEQMVAKLTADYELLIDEMGLAMQVAEEHGDDGTADMLLGMRTSLETHVWMLKSYLGK
ncbi:DNA starvation/stationary phase protection protein [Paenibacillus allorhizosphaerae]|uniref:DNA protection during starvation protein 1 n=1 Tax=Paenibacillus allorhizosphaerae TaxID=2849866 RepID=A0ABM8VJK3_9BACL|nr:DNA starvation/stationary phase protection protein [Paenibacillus allorhizosphaerae]CAG7645629.1 DNA protection during starvation protein 1 [Paenibacillus allorhizosphaerae]